MVAADGTSRWALVLGVALVLAAGTFRVHNLDVWLHARTGEWIVAHGEVPTTNVMSELHGDYPSVHDKWLFQVLTHGLLDGVGPGAMIALRLLLMGGLFVAMSRTARGLGASPGATLLTVSLACLASRARFFARPDLVSMALLGVFTWVALVRCPDGRRALGWLLPLQVLWANTHGYFLLGWVLPAAVAGSYLLTGRAGRERALRWGGIAVVLCAASLLTPNGWRGWWHPFDILLDLSAHKSFYSATIEEFLPTFAPDPRHPWDRLGFVALLALATLAVGLEVVRRVSSPATTEATEARQVPPADRAEGGRLAEVLAPTIGLLLLFGVMAPSLRRNMAPFAIVAAGPTAAALSAGLGRLRVGRRLIDVAAAIVALAVIAGEVTDATSIHDGLQRRAGWGLSRIAYPDAGIAFLARELPDANVATAFRYGSTFTGRRWPAQAASTNGNTHGYPTAWLQEVMAAAADEDPMAFWRLARAHGHDAALIPMEGPLAARLLRDPDWTLVFLGVHEAVFVQRASVDPDWLAAHDLEARVSRGEVPLLPPAERRPPWGVARPVGPSWRAAALLWAGGFPQVARQLAEQALDEAPSDPAALALAGLLALETGDVDRGLERLRLSRADGGFHPLAEQVDQVLARRGE